MWGPDGLPEPFTFGFLGRAVPAKGIALLLDAFEGVQGAARLRLWCRSPPPELVAKVGPPRVEWMGGYDNADVVARVLNHVDAVVVPSVWDECSPLVIHEAQQARVAVVTAAHGSMGELVADGVKRLTFEHRSAPSLRAALQRAVDAPASLAILGACGSLLSPGGDVVCIRDHVASLERLYRGMGP